MPDHAKIALKELRAAIHNVNEAIFRLSHTLAHSSFVSDPEARIGGSDLFQASQVLEKEVLPLLTTVLEEATKPKENN